MVLHLTVSLSQAKAMLMKEEESRVKRGFLMTRKITPARKRGQWCTMSKAPAWLLTRARES